MVHEGIIMKAWVLNEIGEPLQQTEVTTPTVGHGEVLIKVRAAGLCHSDVAYMAGHFPITMPAPVILGHELSGEITEIGTGVAGFQIGDAVATVVSATDAPGITRTGAYAEYAIGKADNLVKLPEGMDWAQAAASTDAGVTSYTGVVVHGEITAGQRVGIIGLGGLGMTGARIAVVQGATVYGVEPKKSSWDLALQNGVAEVYDDISKLEGMGLDVVVDFAGFGTTTAGALRAVKKGGIVVLVGFGVIDVTISAMDLISNTVQLRGSTPPGDPAHLRAVLDMVASGQLTVTASKITFDEIPDGLARLGRGEVTGRLVAMLD